MDRDVQTVDVLQVPTVLQLDVRTVQHASQASSLSRQLKQAIQATTAQPLQHAMAGSQHTVIPTYSEDNPLFTALALIARDSEYGTIGPHSPDMVQPFVKR
jgi:hypothetical protein